MKLAEMSWPQVTALSPDVPIVIPTAALEQHGHHLPLFTDSLLVGEVTRRAEAALAEQIVLAPVMWLGNSAHHLDFAGTMSAGPRTYIDLVADMVENFLLHGFKRIVIINGHGGNNVPGQQALFEVRQRHRDEDDLLLLFAAYWALGARPHEIDPSIAQQAMQHACEWETSMMLALAPQLVGDYRAAEPVDPRHPLEPAMRAWITKDRTAVGHVGDPAVATAEKGETLLKAFADDAIGLLKRVIEWSGHGWN